MTWGYRLPKNIQEMISTVRNDLNFDDEEKARIIHALTVTYRKWTAEPDIHPTFPQAK